MKYRILFSLGKEDSLHIFTRLAARENMGVSSLPSENKIRYFTRNKKYSLYKNYFVKREGPFFAHKADCHEIWHTDRTLCLSVGNVIFFVKFRI